MPADAAPAPGAVPPSTPERYAPDDHLGGRSLLVAAAYVVLRRHADGTDEVLLQLRRGTGYMDGWWATLAGHVDPGESVHEAAVREAAEEAGVVVAPDALRPLTVLHRFERGGPAVEQRMDAFFEVTDWAGEPSRREPDKTAAMAWFPLDALPEPVVPHERLVLGMLASGGPLPAVLSLPS
ncbi:NUDIX domain-containing protein [Cellulomonas shaoxiangyii]|uniref:NUDIX domain-containing protein n=1 Tax=Cellulomonas shaoxiangyii TaxID=2566013 RepID=A0A4P7SGZ6_9CELL|nr:NUDIX domain-containing protein [Cellulomonas shaoxiangyii]QCB93220.1 NUDIX domain-containing protein [Cellulomonas shaoxiangyii]TGY81414.1 NUDIX domain-containing protein [Cellulomonas shaoxiangyii]